MFWRVELDKSGAILTCDLVPDQGKNGGRVIFVEAETKATACSNAKAWHERRKTLRARCDKKRSDDLKARRKAGLCTVCGRPAGPGKRPYYGQTVSASVCQPCSTTLAARRTERENGAAPKMRAHRISPEEAVVSALRTRKLRLGLGTVLKKFDALGPVAFREWLVAEIQRRTLAAKDQAMPLPKRVAAAPNGHAIAPDLDGVAPLKLVPVKRGFSVRIRCGNGANPRFTIRSYDESVASLRARRMSALARAMVSAGRATEAPAILKMASEQISEVAFEGALARNLEMPPGSDFESALYAYDPVAQAAE